MQAIIGTSGGGTKSIPAPIAGSVNSIFVYTTTIAKGTLMTDHFCASLIEAGSPLCEMLNGVPIPLASLSSQQKIELEMRFCRAEMLSRATTHMIETAGQDAKVLAAAAVKTDMDF